MNGGIIGTIIDCHCICTAIADAYRRESRLMGTEPAIWYATGALNVSYQSPSPIDEPVTLRARITETTDKRTNLSCTLTSAGKQRATAELVAVRVPQEWMAGR